MNLEKSNDLKSAFVLVKCSKKNHDDCRKIRDALVEESSYVQEAYTTNANVDNEQWCVAASALVPSNEAEKFANDLWKISTRGQKPITVKNVKLLINQQ